MHLGWKLTDLCDTFEIFRIKLLQISPSYHCWNIVVKSIYLDIFKENLDHFVEIYPFPKRSNVIYMVLNGLKSLLKFVYFDIRGWIRILHR